MRNTLQARLIILMVIASIFLISLFTAIQLFNQLQRSAEHNLYRANLGALMTKHRLDETMSMMTPQDTPDIVAAKIKDIFAAELKARIIEGAALLDQDASVLSMEGSVADNATYNKEFLAGIRQIKDRTRWVFPVIDKKNRIIDLFILFDNPYGYIARITFSLGNIRQALREVYVPVMITVIMVIAANIILAALLSRALIKPVRILNEATKDIASGDLDRKVLINTEDELEELAGTFNLMTSELKKMKARAENANPLTKLPGNIVIQEEVEKRIRVKEKFALIYCDLDNFKAYNDKYGVHSGDEAIMFTADVIKDAVSKIGKSGDFIGHEGGDDFLLLTSPERAEQLAESIIKEFDKGIINFYKKDDLDRGYIEAKSRDREEIVKFPIMTISLAGVSNTKREINSYPQLTNIAADVKKIAKKAKGSKFVMDRREHNLGVEGRGSASGDKIEF